jgi:3-oxoacyl-[acyl-carrier protein] reductase
MINKGVILITGTRKGIGRYLVEHYVNQGYIVVGCSRENTDFTHLNYFHFCLDVTDELEVKKMFSFILTEFNRLDVLINNAGIASMNHSLLTPISTVRKILDTNIVGTFLFSREAAKLMRKRKFGRIINFATFAIPFKLEGEAIYAASKAPVITLTEILSREYAIFGITVNAVAPPAVKTDLVKGVPKCKMDELLNRQSIHRYGTPEEVSSVIDFFIDANNSLVNGQVIYMGGL